MAPFAATQRLRALPLTAWLAALLSLGVALWAWRQPPFSIDDAYITYRYAHNLATGQGFVYNPGERVLGTTTPLYSVLLALAWHVWPDLPALGIFFSGVGWAAAVGLLYALGRQAGSPPVGLIAAGLLAFDPLITSLLGMETHVYVAVCLLAFYWQRRGHGRLAAVAAGAAFLLRWDGILVVGTLLLAEWVRTRRLPWAAAGVALGVVPWLIFSQLYFGSIFPNTFFAKAGQSLSGLQGGGANPFAQEGLNELIRRLAQHWTGWLSLPLFGLGLVALAARWPSGSLPSAAHRLGARLWPLLLWTVAYTAGYASLSVIGFGWYFVPIIPGVALAIGLGAVAALDALTRRLPSARPALLAMLSLLLFWAPAQAMLRHRPGPAARIASYQLASDWLKANTLPGASVAMLEIGMVGFASERYIVDMMGLVTPSMLGHLSHWDQVNYYAVARHWPDYVLTLNSMALNRPTPDDWFERTYRLAATLENPADADAPLRVYQRRANFPPASYAAQWPQGLVFDRQFELSRLEAATPQLAPGAAWPVRLSWRVLADVTGDYQFDYELVNLQDGQRWSLVSGSRPFYEGNPTNQWRAGDAYDEQRLLVIPPALPPGDYRLLVRAFAGGAEVVPARPATGASATAMSGRLTTAAPVAALPPFLEAPVNFAGGLTLRGFRPEAGRLVLYWQTDSPVASPLTAFIHVLDETNNLVDQHDSAPALGQMPTIWWEPGLTVVDAHPLAPPSAARASFCVGLYDSLSHVRLPVLAATGYTVHDDVACRPWPVP